jgi:hypothetical protein
MSVLFLFAGYPGVGKTSLLVKALRTRFPLFGREDDALFQRTRLPSRLPEWSLTFDEVLREGTWFSRTHTAEFARLDVLPEAVVMHIDLLNFSGRRPEPADPDLSVLFPRTYAGMSRDEDNRRIIGHKLADPFFARFDRVLVHTVHAPWEICAKRWRVREGDRGPRRPYTAFVMANRDPGEAIHASVYRSWIESVGRLNPALHLVGDNSGPALRVKRLTSGSSVR